MRKEIRENRKGRYTREDALNDREFQLLLEGAREMEHYYSQQARFIILVAGRLGMRKGEITHIQEEWIDWRKDMIEIPRFEPCDKGKNGGACGYCKQQAKQAVEYNEEANIEEEIRCKWEPKTEAAARKIPFGFDPRTSLILERFFDRYDEFCWSAQAITRRVKKAAKLAEELNEEEIYPHCLRATAATYHASRGLEMVPLQAMFGWAQPSTAMNYIQNSGENTARALHMVHSQ